MNMYSYCAVDSQGKETKGALRVATQTEALKRIKEMGYFPTKVSPVSEPLSIAQRADRHLARLGEFWYCELGT